MWHHRVVPLTEGEDTSWEGIQTFLDHFAEAGWELVTFEFRPLATVRGGTSMVNFALGAGAKVDASFGPSFAIFKRPAGAAT